MHYSPLTQVGSMSIRALKKTRAPFSKLGLGFRVSSKDYIIQRLILGPQVMDTPISRNTGRDDVGSLRVLQGFCAVVGVS